LPACATIVLALWVHDMEPKRFDSVACPILSTVSHSCLFVNVIVIAVPMNWKKCSSSNDRSNNGSSSNVDDRRNANGAIVHLIEVSLLRAAVVVGVAAGGTTRDKIPEIMVDENRVVIMVDDSPVGVVAIKNIGQTTGDGVTIEYQVSDLAPAGKWAKEGKAAGIS
jgi:hypothetical protein